MRYVGAKYHSFKRPDTSFDESAGEFVVKRKASQTHFCNECDGEIKTNEEYYQDTFYDMEGGYPSIFKICEKCWKGQPMKAYNKKVYPERYADGMLM